MENTEFGDKENPFVGTFPPHNVEFASHPHTQTHFSKCRFSETGDRSSQKFIPRAC